jgi:HSP20 family molecular chaperone IbpA
MIPHGRGRNSALKRSACRARAEGCGNGTQKRVAFKQLPAQRECVALRDLTDCLLEAYDCVARRAYEKFVKRGGSVGGELQDWISAERELLPVFPVNIAETEQFIYVMASIPGSRISVGIESRWLVILAHDSVYEAGAGPQLDSSGNSHDGDIEYPSEDVEKLDYSVVRRKKYRDRTNSAALDAGTESGPGPASTSRVVELPAVVDAAKSIAILSNGLLGIRMPKETRK